MVGDVAAMSSEMRCLAGGGDACASHLRPNLGATLGPQVPAIGGALSALSLKQGFLFCDQDIIFGIRVLLGRAMWGPCLLKILPSPSKRAVDFSPQHHSNWSGMKQGKTHQGLMMSICRLCTTAKQESAFARRPSCTSRCLPQAAAYSP